MSAFYFSKGGNKHGPRISQRIHKDKAVEEAAQSEIGKIIEISTGVQNAADEETSKIKAVLPTVEKLAESESTKISDVTRDITAVSDKAKTDMSASVKGVTDKATEAGSSIESAVAGVNGLATTEKENIQKVINGVNTVASDEEIKIKDVINNVNAVANTEKTKIQQVLPTVQANVAEVQTKIDDASAQIEALIESGAVSTGQLAQFLAGKKLNVTNTIDLLTNTSLGQPNKLYRNSASSLTLADSTNWVEENSSNYDLVSKLDGQSLVISDSTSNNIQQVLIKFDIVADVERIYPKLFSNLNIVSRSDKIAYIKKICKIEKIFAHGFGSGSGGNRLSIAIGASGTSWDGTTSTAATAVSRIEKSVDTAYYIRNDGFCCMILYSVSSNWNYTFKASY